MKLGDLASNARWEKEKSTTCSAPRAPRACWSLTRSNRYKFPCEYVLLNVEVQQVNPINMAQHCIGSNAKKRYQHARGARGAGARCLFQCAFEARSLRFMCVLKPFTSAVLMTLRIAEGRCGTRETNEQLDLASNALKGNVLS